MNDKATTQEATKEGTPSRGTLQSYLQNFTKEAIDKIVETMRSSRNENLRFGAAKLLLDKTVPDIKGVEITGENGEPIKLTVIGAGGFIPQPFTFTTSSAGGTLQPTPEVQGAGMAQKSSQDNNSNNGSGQAVSS